MAEDRISKTYINNLSECALNAIYDHLRDAGFFYMAHMLEGTELDLPPNQWFGRKMETGDTRIPSSLQ
ncbi:hypothetical protein V6Z12_D03G061800 [Gossypium hirsutum]